MPLYGNAVSTPNDRCRIWSCKQGEFALNFKKIAYFGLFDSEMVFSSICIFIHYLYQMMSYVFIPRISIN
jgi:hypothetical protein